MENPARIAIIDDNPDFLFTMETFLQKNGFETLTAQDGKKGLELVEKERPDLILLDIMMESTFSGLELCKTLRRNPDLKDIPILGLSGIGNELGIRLGKWGDDEYFRVDEFFDKPIDRERLLASIKTRLKKGVIKRDYLSR